MEDFVPDSFKGHFAMSVSHRNRTTQKIQGIFSGQRERLVNYLISLIQGFLLPFDQKNYLCAGALPGREIIQFPIHSLVEIEACLGQFVRDIAIHYRQNFSALVTDTLGSRAYAEMWRVGDVSITHLEPYRLTRAQIPAVTLLALWRACNESPRAYLNQEWVRQAPREKLTSVMVDPRREPLKQGEPLDLREDSDQAFKRISDKLTDQVEDLSIRLEKKRQNLTQTLTEALARFNGAQPGAQEESQESVAKALYSRCHVICSKIAYLEAKKRYLLRYQQLHEMQAMNPLSKLIALVQKSCAESGSRIPVRTIAELRDQIEFLIEYLHSYAKEAVKDILLRANKVNVVGDPKELTEQDKLILGLDVAPHLQGLLTEWLEPLQKINSAEVRREAAKEELRGILRRLITMRDKFAQIARKDERAIDAAENEISLLIDQKSEEKRRRRDTLVRLAPGHADADAIINFHQLFVLYQGTRVTEAYLQGLYDVGFSNKSTLLYFASHSEPSVLHLLNEGACVDFRVDGIQVLARAYDAISRGAEGTPEQVERWRVFALLSGAKQLFESPGNADWLSQQVTRLLERVRSMTQVSALSYYEERDGLLVKALFRRLILSLYLGVANKETISNSPIFDKLVGIWGYLGISIQTPQMLPGELCAVNLEKLRAVILKATLAIFSTPEYKEAQRLREQILLPGENRVSVDDRVTYRSEIDVKKITADRQRESEMAQKRAQEEIALLREEAKVAQERARREMELLREQMQTALRAQTLYLMQRGLLPADESGLQQITQLRQPQFEIEGAPAPALQPVGEPTNQEGDQEGRHQNQHRPEVRDIIASQPAARAEINSIFAPAHASSDSETTNSSDAQDEAAELSRNNHP